MRRIATSAVALNGALSDGGDDATCALSRDACDAGNGRWHCGLQSPMTAFPGQR
jgi:hypothetical protein